MHSTRILSIAALAAFTACSHASSSARATGEPSTAAGDMAPQQTTQWGPAPAVFPPGAEFAPLT